MNFNAKRLYIRCLLLIFFASFLLRLPGALFSPTTSFYDWLEMFPVFSTLSLFAGQTPHGITLWSSGIICLPLILIYTLGFFVIKPLAILSLFQHNLGTFIKEFSIYIVEAFLNPTWHLIAGRILVAIIASCAPLALFNFFFKKRKIIAAVFSAVICLSSPFFVEQSYTLLTDTIGLTFFTFSLIIILGHGQLNSKKILEGGILFGLALAGKFLYLAFLPVAFLAIYLSEPRDSVKKILNLCRDTLIFMIGVIVPVFIFIPFIWTNPLSLTKNIFGVLLITASGPSSSWRNLVLNIIPSFINYPGLLFCIVGIFSSFYVLGKKLAILLGLSFILFLIPLGQSNSIYARYALSLIPFLCIYAGIGMDFVLKLRLHHFKKNLITLVIGAVFIGNTISIIKNFTITHSSNNTIDGVNWIKKNIKSGSTIAIPECLVFYFVPSVSTLERWIELLNKSQENITLRLDTMCSDAKMQCGNFKKDNPLIPAVFCTYERKNIFISKMLLWYLKNADRPKINFTLFLYPNADFKSTLIELTREEILNLFLEKRIGVLVSVGYLSVPSSSPYIYFNKHTGQGFFIYINENLNNFKEQQ